MIVHKMVGAAAVLLGMVGVAVAPLASAAPPQPGAPCSPTDTVSADGTLFCSHQALIWMHNGLPLVEPGQPCTRPGDVTYAHREQIVTCRPSGSGLTWQ
jgi:hypothetical protein